MLRGDLVSLNLLLETFYLLSQMSVLFLKDVVLSAQLLVLKGQVFYNFLLVSLSLQG